MNITLPRSIAQQSKLRYKIARDALRDGDLALFMTSRVFKHRHVGMNIKANRFLYASTSRGMMISILGNPNWDDSHWHSRRILYRRD